MKRFLLLMLLHGLTLMVVAAQSNTEGAIDSGKLLTSINGEQIGTETFTIKNESVGESDSVLTVNGQTINIKTRTEYSDAHAAAFELEYGPSMKMKVSVNGSEVKVTGSQEATAQTDSAALFLENNVGYQYYFLIRRYDRSKGGVQQFKMFVPSIMQTLPLSLELRDSPTSPPGKAAEFEVYRAVIAGAINADIATDTSGKLIFMAVPSQKVETVRGDYPQVKIQAIRLLLSQAPKKAVVDYSAPSTAPFTAEEVTINAKGFTLAGTLLLPKAAAGRRPFPAVITITGSGQQTRDEPIPIPGLEKYGIMRQIAETLAARGIAVLRVDDRGVGQSTGLETLQTATTRDFAEDVRAEIAYLRSRPEIDPKRIALVGHSEGGIIAPMVAADDPQVAAIVLMAGSAKRGDQISMEQLNEALARDTTMTEEEKNKQRREQQEIINAVRTGGDLSKYPAQVRFSWIKEFWTYDPLPTIRRMRQPVLILHGAIDKQVTVEQAGMLERAARAAGNRDVTVRLFPNLNHLFLPARTGAFTEYSTLSTSTVGEDVLKILGDWLETKLKAKVKR